MSHVGHRRRGSERSAGPRSENAGGNSARPATDRINGVSRGMPGFETRNAGAGRRRHEKCAGGPGAELGDFPRAIAGTSPNRGLAGAPERQFPAIFRFSSAFPIFRRISGEFPKTGGVTNGT